MKKQLSTVLALVAALAIAAAPLAAEAKGSKKAKPHASKTAKGGGSSNFGKPKQ